MITTTDGTHQLAWKGRGRQSGGLTVTLHGALQRRRSTLNTALAEGHMQKGGEVTPTLEFRRALAQECLENKIGVEEGVAGRPRRSCTVPTSIACKLVTVAHHRGAWDATAKKFKRTHQKYQKTRCKNFLQCKKKVRTYCNCTKGLFLCVECFTEHKLAVLME